MASGLRPERVRQAVATASVMVRRVAANPAIRRSQLGWLTAITAEWAYVVSLLVFAYTVGGVLAVGLVGMLRMLPAAIVAPFLSTLADRLPRGRVLLGVHLGRAALVGLATAAVLADLPVSLVLVCALLEGMLSTLHRPATMSLQPALARSPEELVASNVAVTFGEGLGVLVGPAVGAVVSALFGAGPGMAVGAAGFVIAGVAVLGLHAESRSTRRTLAATGGIGEAVAGFRALATHRHAGQLVALLGTQTFVRGMLTVLLVAAAVELLGMGESGVGYLTSAMGAGGLIGGVLGMVLLVGRSLAGPLGLGLLLWGLPISLIGLFPHPLLALGLLAVVGAANAVLDVSAFSLLQRSVPNTVRGRVFGALEGGVALTVGVGSLVVPLLVTLIDLRPTLVLVGLILPVLAILSRRAVARTEQQAIVPERELRLLRGVPMFAPLPMTVIEQLASDLEEVTVNAGEVVVREGEEGRSYFVIAAGTASVSADGVELEMGPGEGFVEIALLRDVPRTATVRAATDLQLLRLGRGPFLEAVTGTPQSVQAADALVDRRLAPSAPG